MSLLLSVLAICSFYGTLKYMNNIRQFLQEATDKGYNIGACVSISNAPGDVLLVRRAAADFFGGVWEIPGGAVDTGESVEQAAIREVREETGLELTSTQLHYVTFFDFNN